MTLLDTWRALAALDKDFAARLTSSALSPQHVILYLAENGALVRSDDDSCSTLVGPLLEWLTERWPTRGANVARIRDANVGPWIALSGDWLTGWSTFTAGRGDTPVRALAELTLKLLQAEVKP